MTSILAVVHYRSVSRPPTGVHEPEPPAARPPRLLECARLRVKDVDFARNQLTVRGGKGDNDRMTMLSGIVKADLAAHLERVKRQHERDLQQGAGWIELSPAAAPS